MVDDSPRNNVIFTYNNESIYSYMSPFDNQSLWCKREEPTGVGGPERTRTEYLGVVVGTGSRYGVG